MSWEAGPCEWGAYLSMGQDDKLRVDYPAETGQRWWLEPYHAFDVQFIEERRR